MRRIVVAEDAVGLAGGPRQNRFRQAASEVCFIQFAEDLSQVINFAFVGSYDLSAAGAFVIGGAFAHFGGFDLVRVYVPSPLRHAAAEELGDEDVRKGDLA